MKRLEARKRDPVTKRVGRLLRAFGLLLASSGIAILAMQLIGWFRDGVWPTPTLFDLWLWLGNTYSIGAASGAARIVLWLLDLPLGPTLLGAAFVLLMVAQRLAR